MNREMKDSGIPWLGEYPAKWELKRIQFTLQERIENNSPIRSRDILSLTAKQGVVPLSEKEGGGNKPKEDYSAYRLAYPGDIVMNSMNILSGSVGLSKYFGCVSPVYYMLRPLESGDDVRFYNYIFQTTVFQKSLYGLGNGILIKESGNGKLNTIRMRIPMDKFKKLYIPVPNTEIQHRIADFLDSKCSQIDEISKKIQEEIDTLEEYKKSVITEAVTKGLDPNVEMKDSGIEWIGEIPESWSINRVANVFCERNEPGENGLPFLSVSINSGISDKELSEEETNRQFIRAEAKKNKKVYPGDIVYNMMRAWQGAIGAVRTEGMVSSAYVTAKPMQKIDTRYFEYLLRTPTAIQEMNKYSYGIMDFRKRLYWPYFKNISLCVPPLSEQAAIANYADKITLTTDSFVSSKREQLSVLEEYKKSLIYEYVTGKKEVAYA